jgi:hypothetical protein
VWRSIGASVFIAAGLTWTGCGDGAESGAETSGRKAPVVQEETIRECLEASAVQTAAAQADLSFFWKARRAHDVTPADSARDDSDNVKVRLFTGQGGPQDWMLWASQPASSSLSIPEIVHLRERYYSLEVGDPWKTAHEHYVQRAYVAFKLKPGPHFRNMVGRCLELQLKA